MHSQLNGRVIPLTHPMHLPADVDVAITNIVWRVWVKLTPVGAQWVLRTDADLRTLCRDVLTALAAAHNAGFVHRDVREDNLVRCDAGFVLVDWELAGPIGDPVFWRPAEGRVPPNVVQGTAWSPGMDLWQLGRVLKRFQVTNVTEPFVQQLLDGVFPHAMAGLAALPD
jgi:serine/threonine protein kinase